MPEVSALREESRRYRQTSDTETNPHLKQFLASHALALAQLAEQIERTETPRKDEAA